MVRDQIGLRRGIDAHNPIHRRYDGSEFHIVTSTTVISIHTWPDEYLIPHLFDYVTVVIPSAFQKKPLDLKARLLAKDVGAVLLIQCHARTYSIARTTPGRRNYCSVLWILTLYLGSAGQRERRHVGQGWESYCRPMKKTYMLPYVRKSYRTCPSEDGSSKLYGVPVLIWSIRSVSQFTLVLPKWKANSSSPLWTRGTHNHNFVLSTSQDTVIFRGKPSHPVRRLLHLLRPDFKSASSPSQGIILPKPCPRRHVCKLAAICKYPHKVLKPTYLLIYAEAFQPRSQMISLSAFRWTTSSSAFSEHRYPRSARQRFNPAESGELLNFAWPLGLERSLHCGRDFFDAFWGSLGGFRGLRRVVLSSCRSGTTVIRSRRILREFSLAGSMVCVIGGFCVAEECRCGIIEWSQQGRWTAGRGRENKGFKSR